MCELIDWGSVEARKGFDSIVEQQAYGVIKNIYHLNYPQLLAKAIGFPIYSLGKKRNSIILFRGENKIHETICPSLLRGVSALEEINSRIESIEKFSASICDKFLHKTPKDVCIPLFQHYGLKTPWLDVVDNVWSALWFATHKVIYNKENDGKKTIWYEESSEEYSYICIFDFGPLREQSIGRGEFDTQEGYKIVNLRVAAPSTYVRPHAQHGLLVSRTIKEIEDINYHKNLIGIIRVKTRNALKWLGKGGLVSPSFMFPSEDFDIGYGVLLKVEQCLSENIYGCIELYREKKSCSTTPPSLPRSPSVQSRTPIAPRSPVSPLRK